MSSLEELLARGDPGLAETQATMFRSFVKDATELRRPLKGLAGDLASKVDELESTVDGQRLLASSAAKVATQARNGIAAAVGEIDSQIEKGVERSIQRASLAQMNRMQELGLHALSPGARKAVFETVAARRNEEFPPGSGRNYASRMQFLQDKHSQQLEGLAKRGGGLDRVKGGLTTALTHSAPGKTPISGGSLFKDMQRMQVAEQSRMAQVASTETLRAMGVQFVHWRLNPGHKWYGGNEVCEKFATELNADVADELAKLGILNKATDSEGLYRIDSYPHYPHPFCRCYPDPWYPPEFRLAVENMNAVALKVGEFPDELLQAGSISAIETEAATATLNAVADEVGLGSIVDMSYVEALGPRGAADVLALKIRSMPGDLQGKALGSIRATLVDEMPKTKEKLAEIRREYNKRIKSLTENEIWSKETKASQVAKLHTVMHREIVQNSANLDMMLRVEQGLAAEAMGDVTTVAYTTQLKLLKSMQKMGYSLNEYAIERKGGVFWARITGGNRFRIMKKAVEDAPEDLKAIAKIKSLKMKYVPKGVAKTLLEAGGRKFELDAGQQAGALLIEREKQVLLHFAPGIGKTPLATASVNDLVMKGAIERALIAPPAAVRSQFVQEIMKFSDDKATTMFFVPQSDLASATASMRKSILDDLISSTDIAKTVKKAEEAKRVLTAAERAAYDSVVAKATPTVEDRMSRIAFRGVPRGTDADKVLSEILEKDKTRFVVMSHDDMAAFAKTLPKHVDYVAVDEVHQLTAAAVGEGSSKAEGLQLLTGGRIKYKVGLTGTAVRNNVGELWDIANWLKPGNLPGKGEFMSVYQGLTLKSNMLENSMLRMLRRRIDNYTFTLPSPVKTPLENFLTDPGKKLRKLEMSATQVKRSKSIEAEFHRMKVARAKMTEEEVKNLEAALEKKKGVLKDYLGKFGVADAESTKVLGLSADVQERVKGLVDEIDETTKFLSPSSWRDNQHFQNLHDMSGKSNAKVQELKSLMGKQLKNEKVIVHLEQTSSIESIQSEMGKAYRIGVYSGDMSMAQRDVVKQAFNNGELDMLLVTRAGSTGVNLQKASAATVHFDTPYTYAEYLQREARNWRRGQERTVKSFLLHNDDHYLDKRRFDIMVNKKKVLDAVDEASKLSDVSDKRVMMRALTRKDMMSYERLLETKGRDQADDLLREMCGILKLADGEPCPYQPKYLGKIPSRPVLSAGNKVHRSEVIAAKPGKRPTG